MDSNLINFENNLIELIGKEAFEIIKGIPFEEKEAILEAAPYINLANKLNQLFWIGNKNHETSYVNSIYTNITEYSLKECLRKSSNFCFTEESKKNIAKHHLLRLDGKVSQYEGDILSKTGKVIPVLINGFPIKNGGTMGLFTNLKLVDKLKRADDELLKIVGENDFKVIKEKLSKKQINMILKLEYAIHLTNVMGHGFWMGDEHHLTIYANEIYQKTTGYSLEECIKNPSDFCFDEESKNNIARQHNLRKKGISSQYEGSYITKSGQKIPILVIGAPNEDGGTYGIHVNLTEIKKLTESKTINDEIIRNSVEAIVVLDKNQKIKLWNNGAIRLFGYEEKEVLDKPIKVIIPERFYEQSDEILKEVNEKKFIKGFETTRQAKNGDLIDVSISITKVVDKNNKFIRYLIIYRDISNQKKINFELQKRFETIQDAYKELGIQKRQMDYIYEITNAAISASTSISSLSNLIISAISILTKSDGVVLRLYDPKFDSLKLASCLGVSQKWLSKNKIPLKGSLAEDAVKNKRPLLIDNIQSSFKHKGIKLIKAHKFTTLILIPLMLSNKIIGTISLYAIDPAKFRFIETDFLENFSKQCSLALHIKTLEKKPDEA